MNYTDLTAKELRALCEQRGIKPSRAKADMVEDLMARDAADELTQLTQDLGLDEPVTASEEPLAPEVQEEPEKPAERPVALLEVPHLIVNGVYYKEFPRDGDLEQSQHDSYLRRVESQARSSGFEVFGPPFRAANRTTHLSWVYGINVRNK